VLTSASNTNFPAGSVLQVVNSLYTTQVSNTSATFADTGMSASITPTKSSSKILVFVSHTGCLCTGSVSALAMFILLRSSTSLYTFGAVGNAGVSTSAVFGNVSVSFLDSPATTSSITYKTQFANKYAAGTVYVNTYDGYSTMTLMEIAA
jgi:hypothetical protein